jgi:RNA-directed DNA polymerase
MRKLDQLKVITTKPELARLLGLRPSFFTYTLYKTATENQYTQFTIPKKSGGDRKINAPTDKLKSIQSALSTFLLDCIDEINQERFPNSELARPIVKHAKVLKIKCGSAKTKQQSLSHGFERKRSIITNAMMHIGQKNVLNIDLENFFQNFNFGRVRGFFIKNNNFNLHPNVATTIAKIACHENSLPQGSPCSPVITNLITHSLDIRLAALASKHSCIYSRYADDITFSTRKSTFPPQLMREENDQYIAGKPLRSEIRRAGFAINEKKTRIQYQDSRQDVTGLVVNKKPSVKKEYWRTARAQCHLLFKTGAFTKTVLGVVLEGNINELQGQLNFIDQLDHYNRLRQKPALNPMYQFKRDELAKGQSKQRRYLFNSREKTLSLFIFYRLFYANQKPTILTEGKTDNIYLITAINLLAGAYPTLAQVKPYDLLCNFVKYSERTRFLLELYGGGNYLRDFTKSYKDLFGNFKAPKPAHPVIMFVDNDDGPSGPKNLIHYVANISSAKIFPSHLSLKSDIKKSDFVYLFENLYLVLTPNSLSNENTDIEHFFTDADRLRKHNGRCFNTEAARDGANDLSKDEFARHIVKGLKKQIDFDRFKPLLDRIVMVQQHFDSIK